MKISRHTRFLLIIIVGLIAASVIAAIYALQLPQSAPAIKGVLIQQPGELKNFTLIDHHQRPFTKDNLLGKWHFVSYGYTFCPDICPITLSILSTLTRQLDDYAHDTGVLFYSVDPARDTPARLAEYVPYFNRDFIGLTYREDGPKTHRPFERGMGMVYEFPMIDHEGNFYDQEHYPVNHGVMIYLLNPDGNLQAVFTPDFDESGMFHFSVDRLLADYRAIRGYLDNRGF